MMYRLIIIFALLVGGRVAAAEPEIVWPPAPGKPKIGYVGEIRCPDLKKSTGLFGKVKRAIAGGDPTEELELPFDLDVVDDHMFLTCQNIPGLVKVNLEKRTFDILVCEDLPLLSPVAVTAGDQAIFVSDSERGVVYRMDGGKLKPWITSGLARPTGMTLDARTGHLYVVDTGDHQIKVFDLEGNLVKTLGHRSSEESGLNFPTFAAATPEGGVLVNDSLNYRIKRFDPAGVLLASFGKEGNGPGAFARPKGIAVDSRQLVYVVDNLFDNIQIFSRSGDLLLVVGTGGSEPGEFWSPGGIAVDGDLIYVADTYNHRIQILRFLGDG